MGRLVVHLTRFAGAIAAIGAVAYTINAMTRTGGYVTVTVLSLRTGVPLAGSSAVRRRESVLDVWGSTLAEQFLSRADVLLAGLSAGVAALLLPAVLRALMAGRPLGRGEAARLGWIALAVTVAVVAGPWLTRTATAAVIDRAGLGSTFAPASGAEWGAGWPVAALLLVLAVAARAGARRTEAAEAASAG
ncbi:hypothetical protein ACBI99_03670 [Nonomuraea sp. ATR24]|uniref:hypothetical protein n=1 Tax=Nonomuraea sp. ATR24 TaxID=1676744 RepID=UPI0035C19C90